MKQIFTLCSAIVLSLTSAFGQSKVTFETISNFDSLSNKCWQFNNLGLSSSSIVNGTKSAYTNSPVKAAAYIITPYVNLTTATTIAFNYKLVGNMTGKRYIRVSLIDINNQATLLGSVTIDRNTSNNVELFTITSTVSGIQKFQIELTSGSEGATDVHIDDIAINSEFNYNSIYNCNMPSQSPLPIHLKSFQGLVNDDKAQLQWTVADNEAGDLFEIQKSSDAKEFKTIALVGTTQKTGEEIYTYNDDLQTSAYYRLKLVNKGSAAIYSDVLFMKNQGTGVKTLSLLQNPVKNVLKFTFTSDINSQTEIAVYNMLGVKVFQSSFAASKGANTVAKTLDGQIKGGTYVLEVKNATNRSIAKFLKD
ncbi:MAG: T9SS type A sorting domain-containing protein [Chitinophagaceae bacterium]|nr:MAG: T9SS type A sorting domain-containing protein [Chitinophagaceae bacterium]